MMNTLVLPPDLVARVLSRLDIIPAAPTLHLLDSLVNAYTKSVPWESASRIVRRAQTETTEDCPRWPVEFWETTLHAGTGGTCYESNLAFFALLQALGFTGYLTVNDMEQTRGCHSALVVEAEGGRYLVDVGLPLHVPIPIQHGQETHRQGWYHHYTLQPQADGVYSVIRDKHPKPICYTFLDTPVPLSDYQAITVNDYTEKGLFLDQVIVTKVKDGVIWRFNGDAQPYQIEAFLSETDKQFHYVGMTATEAAPKVAVHFGISAEVIALALEAVQRDRNDNQAG
jgi:arylamine N-acetyltransferase